MLVAVVLSIARSPRSSTSPTTACRSSASCHEGFPPFTVPDVRLADLGPLVGGALGIALVSLTDTISTASSFAARTGEEVDGQREMIGIGAANLAAGLFQGFPVSTSGSRTAVAEQAGAKTQVTGLVGAASIVADPAVLPRACSATSPNRPSRPWSSPRRSRSPTSPRRCACTGSAGPSSSLSIAAFLGVVLLGVLPGIALAVALSIGNVFRRAWWPYQTVLGRVPGPARATTTCGATRTPSSCPAA